MNYQNDNNAGLKPAADIFVVRSDPLKRTDAKRYRDRMTKILSTDRLFLREWKEDDFAHARSLWADPDVMAFLGGPLSD